jgi:hypothetical protein
VVGLNSMEKTILLGKCKWGTAPAGRGVLRKLVSKSEEIVPRRGQWRLLYAGFARDGWTEAAHDFAADKQMWAAPASANWQPVGLRLLDVQQVDPDLHCWLKSA